MGKSFRVIEYLKGKKINFEYLNTYSSPLAFYRFLYENKDKDIIIFDDLHGTSDPLIKSMFKSACGELSNGTRIVSYNSTTPILEKEGLPSSFEVNAGIVLIFNEILLGFEPIINRGVNIKFNFSFKDKITIFEGLVNSEVIDDEVLDYVKSFCNASTRNLSIRTMVMLSRLKKDNYDFKKVAEEILEDNEDILDLMKLDEKEWCDKHGKHRSTFYRLKGKYKI
jgi:hypothetical protein